MASYPGVEEITVSATGNLGSIRSASPSFTGYAAAQLVGAFSGVIKCRASADNGTTWTDIVLVNMTSGATIDGGTGIAGAGYYRADVGGCVRFKWECTTYTSGTPAFYPSVREG